MIFNDVSVFSAFHLPIFSATINTVFNIANFAIYTRHGSLRLAAFSVTYFYSFAKVHCFPHLFESSPWLQSLDGFDGARVYKQLATPAMGLFSYAKTQTIKIKNQTSISN